MDMDNHSDNNSGVPTVATPAEVQRPRMAESSRSSSGSSDSSDVDTPRPDHSNLQRPQLGSRRSSGTIIIPRDSETIELQEEDYDADDARTMSPRRPPEEVEKLTEEAKCALIEQAKQLQASLLALVDRVESVRVEHEKLEGGNKFLQSYIGELMATSKITLTAPPKGKGKSRMK